MMDIKTKTIDINVKDPIRIDNLSGLKQITVKVDNPVKLEKPHEFIDISFASLFIAFLSLLVVFANGTVTHRNFSNQIKLNRVKITSEYIDQYHKLQEKKSYAQNLEGSNDEVKYAVEDYYKWFWSLQGSQFISWRDKFIIDYIYENWMVNRKKEYKINNKFRGISYKEGYSADSKTKCNTLIKTV